MIISFYTSSPPRGVPVRGRQFGHSLPESPRLHASIPDLKYGTRGNILHEAQCKWATTPESNSY